MTFGLTDRRCVSAGFYVGIFEQQNLALDTRKLLSGAGYLDGTLQVLGLTMRIGRFTVSGLPYGSNLKYQNREILRTTGLVV